MDAVDVAGTQRNWYSSYTNKVVGGHARNVHWAPENKTTSGELVDEEEDVFVTEPASSNFGTHSFLLLLIDLYLQCQFENSKTAQL